ncbi:hypothetical protein A2V82_16565 [candidate division KSB1 bacterium RBG_16_48_16]|nr:MAG: hypothetical protein A2V82_16565 [candidate division KSB1 bacterium RBG_16_48_16]
MGYKSVVNRPAGNRAQALSEIWKFFRATGWTLHDSASKTVEALAASIDTSGDLVNATAHGFVNGNRVFYTAAQAADVIGGLSHGTNYFVVGVAANTFQLSLTQGGAAIDFTSQGGGTHTFERLDVEVLPAGVDITLEKINSTAHGFANGDKILYRGTGTAIGGLTLNTFYFVIAAAANEFQLSLTQGGAAINFTSTGTGVHTFGEGQRVYKSNGENADRIYEYIRIYWSTANAVTFDPWYLWNATTHVGSGGNTTYTNITTSETGSYLWLYGDKNLIFIVCKVAAAYTSMGFGHVPKRFWATLTTLTSPATSGTNVVINVANAADFIINNYYQMVGVNGEGRDRVQVTAKTSNTLTITSLPRNYASGSFIGQCPSTFSLIAGGYNIYMTCSASVAGLTDTSTSGGLASQMLTDSAVDPDTRGESKYVMTPLMWMESSVAAFAYNDKYFFRIPTTGLAAEDTVGVGEMDAGTSTSDPNTSTTLKDNTKAWGTDVHAGKVVIITFGVGVGQIKKIATNTGTILILATGEVWVTTPDNTSQYVICTEGYRYFSINQAMAYREGM